MDNPCRHVKNELQRALKLRWDGRVPGFANLRDDNVTEWYSSMFPRNASRAWDKDEALSSKAIAVRTQARHVHTRYWYAYFIHNMMPDTGQNHMLW